MKQLVLALVAVVALSAPLTAQAKQSDDGSKNAAKACKAERTASGRDAFNAKYGANKNRKNAFGKCVSRTERAQERAAERAERNAAKTCKAEREADPAAFEAKYGSNKNGKNALGKCVSRTVDDDSPEPTPVS